MVVGETGVVMINDSQHSVAFNMILILGPSEKGEHNDS